MALALAVDLHVLFISDVFGSFPCTRKVGSERFACDALCAHLASTFAMASLLAPSTASLDPPSSSTWSPWSSHVLPRGTRVPYTLPRGTHLLGGRRPCPSPVDVRALPFDRDVRLRWFRAARALLHWHVRRRTTRGSTQTKDVRWIRSMRWRIRIMPTRKRSWRSSRWSPKRRCSVVEHVERCKSD